MRFSFKKEIFTFLEIDEQFYDLFIFLFYVGVFELTTQFVLRINIGILKGSHRFDVAYRFEGLAAFLRLSSAGILVFFESFNIFAFSVLYSASKIICDSLSFAYIGKQIKGVRPLLDKTCLKDMLDVGASSLIISISAVVLNSLPIILFGKIFGVGNVFLYSIPFSVSIILTRLINAIYHGFTPRAAELKVTGNEDDIFEISSFGVKFAVLICFCFLSAVIGVGNEVLQLWLGTGTVTADERYLMYMILVILLGFVFFETAQKPNIFVYKSVGLHWIVTTETLLSVVVFLLFSLLFFDVLDELVFALGLLSVGIFKYFYYKFVGRAAVRTYSLPVVWATTTVAMLALLFVVCSFDNLLITVFSLVIGVFAFISLFFMHVFSQRERENVDFYFSEMTSRVKV